MDRARSISCARWANTMALLSDVTEDRLLGGQVVLRQPAQGYRAAIDPVMLAAAVAAEAGETVLDVGAGVGAAALCLARRVPGCRIKGIELQRELVRLASENVALNGFGARVDIMVGDVSRPPPKLAPGSYHHVMANPPYLEPAANDPSPIPGKRLADTEGVVDLASWVGHCLTMARSGGHVVIIQRADRLAPLVSLLARRAGNIAVFPLWPFDPFGPKARPAHRIIARARVGGHGPLRLLGGLVLHRADGEYTEEAEAVLRHGAPLVFDR